LDEWTEALLARYNYSMAKYLSTHIDVLGLLSDMIMEVSVIKQSVQQIMQEAVKVSSKTFGDSLKQVWLFGSHARGEANDDSDIDFMVVLTKPVESWKYICTVYNDFTVDMLNRYGELPSVFITHEANFIEEPAQLYKSVKKEGMLVYG